MSGKPRWKYGFYDSNPDGNYMDPPVPQENPTIYWRVFGILEHDTEESALHTARKSVWGQSVIVRRRGKDATEWEHAPGYDYTGRVLARSSSSKGTNA